MIGIKARGLCHAARIAGNGARKIFFFAHGSVYPNEGIILQTGNEIFILNNCIGNARQAPTSKIRDLMSVACMSRIVILENKPERLPKNEFTRYFKTIIVLPEDFDKQFEDFVASNRNFFKGLNGDDVRDTNSKYLFMLSDGSKNFFYWAHLCLRNGVRFSMIEQVLRWNERYSQLSNKLKKGSITAYTKFDDVFNLIDEQVVLRKEKRVSNTINMFNTTQKKLLKGIELKDDVYEIMSRFNRLSETKKNNFIRKMSTVEDPVEIIREMSFLADCHFSWNKEAVLSYIKNNEMISAEIIVDRDDILLVRVQDFDTTKRLAKNTSWCISKNKTYWNNYMSPSHIRNGYKQYILFDFSKKEDDNESIIGFTINSNKGITASHNYRNKDILDNKFNASDFLRKRFNTLVPNKRSAGGIHAILNEKGISLSSLMAREACPYLWNAESFIKYLSKCLNDDETFDILTENDGMIAIMVENPNIMKVFGKKYGSHINPDNAKKEHILFANFNALAESPDRLFFGILEFDENKKEYYCDTVRNADCDIVPYSFDSLLDDFGLPYDIISRADDKYDRFLFAFSNYDLSSVKKLITEKRVINGIKEKEDCYALFESFQYVTFSLNSDEYLKVIYDNGLSLFDIFTDDQIITLADVLYNRIARKNIPSKFMGYEALLKRDNEFSPEDGETLSACYIAEIIIKHECKIHPENIFIGRLINRLPKSNNFRKKITDEMAISSVAKSDRIITSQD